MKHRPLTVFFVLAFVLPWAVWGTTLAEQAGLLAWHIPQSLAFWLGLTLASYLAASLTGGLPAVRDLLVRMIRLRVPLDRYAIAIGLTPVLAGAVALLALVLGTPVNWGADLPVGGIIGAFALNAFMWWITEETAWRGFALPRLQHHWNPLIASVILGLIWGVWHLPLFFIAGSFQSRLPFLGFLVSITATSVIIGWLVNRSRGSVAIAAFFHATTDVAIAFSGVMASGSVIFWVFVATQVVAALAVSPSLARMRRDL